SALVGSYFWEWDPNGSASNVGPTVDSFSPQNDPAQAQVTAGFEIGSGFGNIFLQNAATGTIVYANMANGVFSGWGNFGNTPGWTVEGVGDITGNGCADVVIQNASGQIVYG